MGFFDSKWEVVFSYREGGIFLGSTKKSSIIVDASSKYDAERTAKKVLNNQYKDVKITEVIQKKR